MRYLVVVLMFMASLVGRSQVNVLSSEECANTLSAIYNIDEAQYNQCITLVKDKALNSYLREYWALMTYAKANSRDNYKKYISVSNDALSAVVGFKYEQTLISNIRIHRCLVEMCEGNWVTGGMQFWKAYRMFKVGEEKYPDYDGQLMLRSIYNILLSQIPEKWKGLAGFFGFGSGDLQAGFAQVDDYHNRVSKIPGLNEESLILTFANAFLSHEQRVSEEQASELRVSRSPLIVYAYLLSCGRKQNGAEADAVLSHLPEYVAERFPLIYHQKAKFAMRRQDPQVSIVAVEKFIETYKGTTCINDAYLVQAYSYFLDGNEEKAREVARRAAQIEVISDIDLRSQADAQMFDKTEINMLRTRMYFEYGKFEESLQYISSFTPSAEQMVEYYFRRARAEEKCGKADKAIADYVMVISMSSDSKRYFGPYAAVYAADIMVQSKNYKAARSYIDSAKKLNNGEFVKEIDQRISLTSRTIEINSK